MIYLGIVLLESVDICTSFFTRLAKLTTPGTARDAFITFPVFRKHEHRLKSKETDKKNKAFLKNEYMALMTWTK